MDNVLLFKTIESLVNKWIVIPDEVGIKEFETGIINKLSKPEDKDYIKAVYKINPDRDRYLATTCENEYNTIAAILRSIEYDNKIGSWAIIDRNFNIIKNGSTSLANKNGKDLIKNISDVDIKIIRKELIHSPVKFLERKDFFVYYFHQAPPLYLITDNKKDLSSIKWLAELLYCHLSVLPPQFEKIINYDAIFNNIKIVTKADNSQYIFSPEFRLTREISEKNTLAYLKFEWGVDYIAIYHKENNMDITNSKYLYKKIMLLANPAETVSDHTPAAIVAEADEASFTNAFESKFRDNNIYPIINGYHNQLLFFCLLVEKEKKISPVDKNYLDIFVTCLFYDLYYNLINLKKLYIDPVIAGLSLELYDSLTTAQLLIGEIQKKNDSRERALNDDLLKKIEGSLFHMEDRIAAYAKRNVIHPNAYLELTPTNVKSVIGQVIDANPELEKKFKIDPDNIDKTLFVNIHEKAFSAVLNEIFKNTFQHAFSDEPAANKKQLFLKISARAKNDNLILTIFDNGKGLKDLNGNNLQECNRVFEPGWKEDKNTPNYGMGLSFVYYIIVNVHHGTIRARSANEIGFEIEIELPLYNAEANKSTGGKS